MSREIGSPNFLDRAIAAVAPRIAFSRAIAREQMRFFGYDGASPGRLRGGSGGLSKNANIESPRANYDRIKIMWDARDMARNYGLVGGLLDRFAMYVCAKIAYQPRTGDPKIDRIYRDYFYDWCTRADLTGRHRLRELVELGFKAMLRDGDFGFIKVRQGRELRLQSIEADRIGSPLEGVGTTSENYIGGFTINSLGQVASVRIFRRSRTGQYTLDVTPERPKGEIPPNQFIHLMKPTSTDQYRPVSWLAAALPHFRDLYELVGFEKQAAKFASMYSGFLVPKDPFTGKGGSTWDTAPTAGEGGIIQASAGQIRQLPGEYGDIKFAPGTERPSNAFMQLFEICVREAAAALNIQYGFAWDMAVFGGVTARIETMQMDRCFIRYRQLLVDRCLEDVKNDVLSLGIGFRDIPPHPNWKSGKWNFGGKLTGDVGHDTASNVQKLQFGLDTQTNLLDADGEEYEEVVETQAKEMQFKQQIAAQYGIPIELLDSRFANATQLLAAINTPPSVPPPSGLTDQADKGKALLDVLEQYGEGLTDRESAIETIVNLYGISRARAESMVPEKLPTPRRIAGSAAAPEKPRAKKQGANGTS